MFKINLITKPGIQEEKSQHDNQSIQLIKTETIEAKHNESEFDGNKDSMSKFFSFFLILLIFIFIMISLVYYKGNYNGIKLLLDRFI